MSRVFFFFFWRQKKCSSSFAIVENTRAATFNLDHHVFFPLSLPLSPPPSNGPPREREREREKSQRQSSLSGRPDAFNIISLSTFSSHSLSPSSPSLKKKLSFSFSLSLSLSPSSRVIILVKAGAPVDGTISGLLEAGLEPGDVIIDGGNEWYENTERRAAEVAKKGVRYIGMGVSGGEEGARNGPSMMPGGDKGAFDALEPVLTKVAAQVDDGKRERERSFFFFAERGREQSKNKNSPFFLFSFQKK